MPTRRTPGPGKQGLRNIIEGFGTQRLRVGFMPEARYEDGTPVAYVAAIQEFGSGPIPPRPFMRPAQTKNGKDWQDQFAAAARAVGRGAISSRNALGAMGGVVAGAISEEISNVVSPPLTMTTLLARKYKQEGGTLSGTKIGELNRQANFIGPRERGDDRADVSGVSTKPLVFDGILIASPSWVVDNQSGGDS